MKHLAIETLLFPTDNGWCHFSWSLKRHIWRDALKWIFFQMLKNLHDKIKLCLLLNSLRLEQITGLGWKKFLQRLLKLDCLIEYDLQCQHVIPGSFQLHQAFLNRLRLVMRYNFKDCNIFFIVKVEKFKFYSMKLCHAK